MSRPHLARQRKFPVLALLAVVALLSAWAIGVAAASASHGSGAPAGRSSAQASFDFKAVPSGQTLTVWLNTADPIEEGLFNDFAKKTGNKITFQAFPASQFETIVPTKWAAGQRPDILQWFPDGGKLQQINPSKNLVPLDNEPWVSRVRPKDLFDYTTRWSDGHVYGIVLRAPYVEGVFYNKAVFRRLGLSPVSGFNNVLSLCKKIKAKDSSVSPIFVGAGDQWPDQLASYLLWDDAIKATHGTIIDKMNSNKAHFTDPTFLTGIEDQKKLADAGCYNRDFLTATYQDEQTALAKGTAAMVIQGSWLANDILGSKGAKVLANIGFFPYTLHSNSHVVGWEADTGGTYFIPNTGNTVKEAVAKAFLSYATSPSVYRKYLQKTKTYSLFAGVNSPLLPPLLQQLHRDFLANGVGIFSLRLHASYGPFETYLQEMLAGRKSPLQVAQALQANFSRNAKLARLPGF
jgi:raffinose/stachyose/melibiose transport system substrate-binding protein